MFHIFDWANVPSVETHALRLESSEMKNKLRWYPQQSQRFIPHLPGEGC